MCQASKPQMFSIRGGRAHNFFKLFALAGWVLKVCSKTFFFFFKCAGLGPLPVPLVSRKVSNEVIYRSNAEVDSIQNKPKLLTTCHSLYHLIFYGLHVFSS
jgi:hypothetical protein